MESTSALALLFYIVAAVAFVAQAAGQTVGRVNLLGVGLAFLTLALIFD